MALAVSGTLTPNTAVDVTVDSANLGIVVVNRTGSGTMWVRLDGVDAVIAADGARPVMTTRTFRSAADGTATVSIISDTALAYTVEAI